jgi:hypothetical protein
MATPTSLTSEPSAAIAAVPAITLPVPMAVPVPQQSSTSARPINTPVPVARVASATLASPAVSPEAMNMQQQYQQPEAINSLPESVGAMAIPGVLSEPRVFKCLLWGKREERTVWLNGGSSCTIGQVKLQLLTQFTVLGDASTWYLKYAGKPLADTDLLSTIPVMSHIEIVLIPAVAAGPPPL